MILGVGSPAVTLFRIQTGVRHDAMIRLPWSVSSRALAAAILAAALSAPAAAQSAGSSPPSPPAEPAGQHQHAEPAPDAGQPAQDHQHHAAQDGSAWQFMQDGVLFATYIDQGGTRASSEFAVQNWWMGMAYRPMGRSSLTVTTMLSLEPATLPRRGYPEIFQVGESYEDAPLVDHQHPHDFLMQFAAVLRVPLGDGTALRLSGAPVGESGVGPPAFMHRRSAAENPIAPLTHHSFDSGHITMGVLGVGLDAGPFSLDGAVFHAREPDEQRWDIMDPGPLDSWSARLRFRPTRAWDLQASHGFLKEPEVFEPQDVQRTTGSISYTHEGRGNNYTALMFAAARNRRAFSFTDALLGELTHRTGRVTVFGRYEGIEVETEHLLFPGNIHAPHPGELIDPLHALTLGSVLDVADIGGWELGVGGDVVLYDVPLRLQESYGERPVSFHVFLRLRLPRSPMGRMWNMTMADGMRH